MLFHHVVVVQQPLARGPPPAPAQIFGGAGYAWVMRLKFCLRRRRVRAQPRRRGATRYNSAQLGRMGLEFFREAG